MGFTKFRFKNLVWKDLGLNRTPSPYGKNSLKILTLKVTASPYVHALAIGSKGENLIEIYWADGRTIFKHELDPTDKQKICQTSSYQRKNPTAYYNPQKTFSGLKITDIAVTDEYVYWTAMLSPDRGNLVQSPRLLTNPPLSEPDFILNDLDNLSAIQMVSTNEKARKLKNSCETRECSDICMSKSPKSSLNEKSAITTVKIIF